MNVWLVACLGLNAELGGSGDLIQAGLVTVSWASNKEASAVWSIQGLFLFFFSFSFLSTCCPNSVNRRKIRVSKERVCLIWGLSSSVKCFA
ncbi:uncharacterized protein B0T23DRAFT_55287 [Neurospora hispaniola]|uniref:Uncharacterized protein n=1 Tax=Neurospora hispaniola TaxID=588809 RepID=A0AAJ0HXY5_9PEZI|nr:hypothetical protein B0T23DRAFT_55287 [Neurospora hispaniola]